MHASLKVLVVGLAALAIVGCEDHLSKNSTESGDDPVVARVNGEPIHESDVTAFYETLPAEYQQIPQTAIEDRLIERLVDRKLLAAAGKKAGVEDTPAFKQKLAEERETLLQDTYLADHFNKALTDDQIKAAYDKIVAKFKPAKEIKARHILVKTKQEALDIIKQLDKGADFAKLAKVKSIGPSAERGGDLGYFTKEAMVPEFSKAAFALKPGTYTKEPIHTQFGWHVIEVEDERDSSPPSFADVRPELRRREMTRMYDKLVADLRKGANVEILYKKKDEAAPAATAGAPAAPAEGDKSAPAEDTTGKQAAPADDKSAPAKDAAGEQVAPAKTDQASPSENKEDKAGSGAGAESGAK